MSNQSIFVLLKNSIPLFVLHEAQPFYTKTLAILSVANEEEAKTLEVFFCHSMSEKNIQEVIKSENYAYLTASDAVKDWARAPHIFAATELNPHNKDWTTIPKGMYCYDELKVCKYFTRQTFNGISVPWCSYLENGELDGTLKPGETEDEAENEFLKLIEHFGSKEAVYKALPLFSYSTK